MARTTISIPDELLQRLRLMAAGHNLVVWSLFANFPGSFGYTSDELPPLMLMATPGGYRHPLRERLATYCTPSLPSKSASWVQRVAS